MNTMSTAQANRIAELEAECDQLQAQVAALRDALINLGYKGMGDCHYTDCKSPHCIANRCVRDTATAAADGSEKCL